MPKFYHTLQFKISNHFCILVETFFVTRWYCRTTHSTVLYSSYSLLLLSATTWERAWTGRWASATCTACQPTTGASLIWAQAQPVSPVKKAAGGRPVRHVPAVVRARHALNVLPARIVLFAPTSVRVQPALPAPQAASSTGRRCSGGDKAGVPGLQLWAALYSYMLYLGLNTKTPSFGFLVGPKKPLPSYGLARAF
jgi:hypothetical protein